MIWKQNFVAGGLLLFPLVVASLSDSLWLSASGEYCECGCPYTDPPPTLEVLADNEQFVTATKRCDDVTGDWSSTDFRIRHTSFIAAHGNTIHSTGCDTKVGWIQEFTEDDVSWGIQSTAGGSDCHHVEWPDGESRIDWEVVPGEGGECPWFDPPVDLKCDDSDGINVPEFEDGLEMRFEDGLSLEADKLLFWTRRHAAATVTLAEECQKTSSDPIRVMFEWDWEVDIELEWTAPYDNYKTFFKKHVECDKLVNLTPNYDFTEHVKEIPAAFRAYYQCEKEYEVTCPTESANAYGDTLNSSPISCP